MHPSHDAVQSSIALIPANSVAAIAECALLNGQSTARLLPVLQQAWSLLEKRFDSDRPFTGVGPEWLAKHGYRKRLEQPPLPMGEALAELDQLFLRDAVYFHQPGYMAHLNCPILAASVVAELITSAVNASVDTWDQSAGGTLIEQALIRWSAERAGLGDQADGVFTSGGTQSNLVAMLLARDEALVKHGLEPKQHGIAALAPRLRIFASEVSHFSVDKAAALLGLGYQAVVKVAVDTKFRMRPEALEQALSDCHRQGNIAMAVVATAGTTDFGSIDPLADIAAIAQHEGSWLHVDAAYGCGLLVSGRHRAMLTGVEHADSLTLDYHKSFFQPVSCSALLVRQAASLRHVTYHADYLNPLSQAREGTPNQVDKSIQTTRRLDALKLWLSLRAVGEKTIGKLFDQLLAHARRVYQQLMVDREFETLHAPELSALVFRYRPSQLLDQRHLDDINRAIRRSLQTGGQALIASTTVHGHCFLKITLLNPASTPEVVQEVIEKIRHLGRQLHADRTPAANNNE